MRHVFIFVFAFVLSACALIPPATEVPSPEPPPTVAPSPTPIVLANTLTAEIQGFRLSYPAGWVTRQTDQVLQLAPDEVTLDRASPGPALVLSIDAIPLDELTGRFGAAIAEDAEALFAWSSVAAQESGYVISPTRALMLDGGAGVTAELRAPGAAGQLSAVLGSQMALRVLGQASAEAWPAEASLYQAILESIRLIPLPTPTPVPIVDRAEQPVVVDRGPDGFVLRLGGSAGPPDGRFVAARGLATAPDGTIYLAESRRGVWIFAADGDLIGTFEPQTLLDAYDVAYGSEGDLFVADFGRNAIARFTADGTFVERWGSAGSGPDQFGFASPQRIAVSPEGNVYALDARPGPESGRIVSSIVRFSPTGRALGRIELPPDLSPTDLAVDANGNVYLADTFGGVVKLGANGQELARFGDPALPEQFAAGAIDVDADGFIYLATYTEGILQLAPGGRVVARGGQPVTRGNLPAPGEFNLPNGLAAAPGGIVWVSDNSGEYSAITALRLQLDQEALAAADEETSATAESLGEEAALIPTLNPETLIRQWASEATASSFYAPDYDPAGATGPPDVVGCQDSPNAWAAATPDTLETLELRYATPVFAVGVVIYHSFNPDFVNQIELIDERGEVFTVYTGEPGPSETCPLAREITFPQTLTRIVGVRLTIDQRSGANWNEIDAVELLGVR
ncbi:NHL repeat-containing protein [Candidatus Chloroploca asiatica]|uniref:Pappalysin-1 SD scarf domain-containing protein n=1 Tax=Candidatus Chloroploca asiatica TaxID=1506545 RepID=A0A2H3KHJ9_9CHLR|nr:NHL repeat-containing protein [Candidatus Chloroploca asiatica]PDV97265.1 hypothetical protein A9Q02_05000 [Candidatus Chloroploca asiatica]